MEEFNEDFVLIGEKGIKEEDFEIHHDFVMEEKEQLATIGSSDLLSSNVKHEERDVPFVDCEIIVEQPSSDSDDNDVRICTSNLQVPFLDADLFTTSVDDNGVLNDDLNLSQFVSGFKDTTVVVVGDTLNQIKNKSVKNVSNTCSSGYTYFCSNCQTLYLNETIVKKLKNKSIAYECPVCKVLSEEELKNRNIKNSRNKSYKSNIVETNVFRKNKMYKVNGSNRCLKTKYGVKSINSKLSVRKSGKRKNVCCSWCNELFSSKYFLKKHLTEYHYENHVEEEKPSVSVTSVVLCVICGEAFSTSDELSVHKKVHFEDVQSESRLCNGNSVDDSQSKESIICNKLIEDAKRKDISRDLPNLDKDTEVLDGSVEDATLINDPVENGPQMGNFVENGLQLDIPAEDASQLDSFVEDASQIGSPVQDEPQLDDYFSDGSVDNSSKLIGHCVDEPVKKAPKPKPVPGSVESYLCDLCGKSFLNKRYLRKHITRHCNRRLPFKCQFCHKGFSDLSRLNKHKCKNPDVKMLYKCNECDKSFTRPSKLNIHKRSHTGERPYQCDQCNKSFIESSKLRCHKLTHSRLMLYQCDQCGKSFRENRRLKVHVRHHTGERPYKCDQCDKSYISSCHLRVHKRTHTDDRPYKCTTCGKTFGYTSSLRVHMSTHEEERPYKCSLCIKTFITSNDLKKHIRVHSGERPYKCEYCNNTYIQSSYVNKHMKYHCRMRNKNRTAQKDDDDDHEDDDDVDVDEPSLNTYEIDVNT